MQTKKEGQRNPRNQTEGIGMKELKVSWDEVIAHLEQFFGVKNIKMMRSRGYEPDSEIYDTPDYIIGEKQ